MIEFSELKEMPKAYAKVCVEIGNPAKKRSGVHNAKYADLDEVINCSKKILAKNGFTIIQYPLTNDGKIGVETMLMHESGEYIKGSFCVPFNNNDPQKVGGAITYYRRYSLVAMLNLVGENDDDADSISQHAQGKSKPNEKQLGAMFYKVRDNSCDLDIFNSIKPLINTNQYKWLMDNFNKENFNKLANKLLNG